MTLRVRVVGAGLIGTSIALALKSKGHLLEIVDIDVKNERLAQDLVGSEAIASPDLVIIATPIESAIEVLKTEFSHYPESRFIDIGGLKSNLLLEVARIPGLNAKFLGTHPMAGREVSGPAAARADLFEGRAWILTPSLQIEPAFENLVIELIESLGASVFRLDPEEHDERIALISHLPQVLSSLLSGAMRDRDSEELSLSGAGLRDTTRLASADPDLWSQLLKANATELLPLLEDIAKDLSRLTTALREANEEEIYEFMVRGNEGRLQIPGKHGGSNRDYQLLPIVIEDKPGQLSRIIQECTTVGVNIEDLSIEHSPGQATGLVTLSLSQVDADKLHPHLIANGWLAHLPRSSA